MSTSLLPHIVQNGSTPREPNMAHSITLQQFEAIQGLFNACRYRPELEAVMAHPLASADYIRNVYFRPEWQLLDACIDAIGYDAADAFPSTIECAANILTDCYIGKTDVVDVLAEA